MRDMTKDNPMHRPEVRARVMRKLHAKRAGKGIPSVFERLVALATGLCLHVTVATGRRGKYPPHYSIDVGCPILKIGIEVDGPSHRGQAARRRDQRKTRLLRSMGWRIYRCTNDQLRTDYDHTISRLLRLVR
jgi:hypothetical protein